MSSGDDVEYGSSEEGEDKFRGWDGGFDYDGGMGWLLMGGWIWGWGWGLTVVMVGWGLTLTMVEWEDGFNGGGGGGDTGSGYGQVMEEGVRNSGDEEERGMRKGK